MIWRLLSAAGAGAAGFALLGWWVTHHSLSRLDVLGGSLRGTNLPLAIIFTNSGYGTVLTLFAVATVGAALALRVSVAVPLTIVVSQIASQYVVNVLKSAFDRTRPHAWLYRHELGFSYPSGHATTAVVFYGAWLIVLWNSPLPPFLRSCATVALGAWALGIAWSRVALGAHYLTDVLGGFLFGSAWLCAALAIALSVNPGLFARSS